MSGKDKYFNEDSFRWSVNRINMRNIIDAYGRQDMFDKGSSSYYFATDILVELLEFLTEADIIDGWDADELTFLLDSMCIK